MYRRVLLLGLLGISAVAMYTDEAFAQRIIGGTIFTKGVRCVFQATDIESNTPTIGVCEIEKVKEALLFCRDLTNGKGNRKGIRIKVKDPIPFVDGVDGGRRVKKELCRDDDVSHAEAERGTHTGDEKPRCIQYDVISNAEGLISSDETCDSEECMALRELCDEADDEVAAAHRGRDKHDEFDAVPVDVVPIRLRAVLNVYECRHGHCPCDPDGKYHTACADAHPLAQKTLWCKLPKPGTFKFEEERAYDCKCVDGCQQ